MPHSNFPHYLTFLHDDLSPFSNQASVDGQSWKAALQHGKTLHDARTAVKLQQAVLTSPSSVLLRDTAASCFSLSRPSSSRACASSSPTRSLSRRRFSSSASSVSRCWSNRLLGRPLVPVTLSESAPGCCASLERSSRTLSCGGGTREGFRECDSITRVRLSRLVLERREVRGRFWSRD